MHITTECEHRMRELGYTDELVKTMMQMHDDGQIDLDSYSDEDLKHASEEISDYLFHTR